MYSQDGVLDDEEARALDLIARKPPLERISIRLLQYLEEEELISHKDSSGISWYDCELTAAGWDALKVYQEKEQ